MSVSSQPLTANLSTSDAIRWNNSELFNGFLWLGLALPTGYATAAVPFTGRKQPVPVYTKIPISAGVLNRDVTVFQNGALEPPLTTYRAYWFDLNGNRIAPGLGSADAFSIATSSYVLSVPVLSNPTYVGISAPQPLS